MGSLPLQNHAPQTRRGLADQLRKVGQEAPPPRTRTSSLAASEARARLSDGRAGRLELALRTNDLDVVGPVVEATLARLGVALPPEKLPLASRAALRGLAEAYREDARRERGVYCDPPERDVAQAAPLAAAPTQFIWAQATSTQAVALTSPLLSEEAEAAKKRRLRACPPISESALRLRLQGRDSPAAGGAVACRDDRH
jgi:hypothetical protein